MLLVHQAGSVKVGEVVRYTLTYTPSDDPILPSPSRLHLRIKNSSAIPLRAAYLRGPYTIHVSTYPEVYDPDSKLLNPEQYGYPQFEPNLKAGGHWHAHLSIPEKIRESGALHGSRDTHDKKDSSVTWIVEISSQILFSASASVHYEFLVARDSRSLDIGFAAIASRGHGEPGQISDLQDSESSSKRRSLPPKGIYCRAIRVYVEDTKTLWNKPPLPSWPATDPTLTVDPDIGKIALENADDLNLSSEQIHPKRQPQKVHLVVLTHGLHSNLGADLLYLKERIDAIARKFQQNYRSPNKKKGEDGNASRETSEEGKTQDAKGQELVIVRGFPGNVVRTERGIQYLGKRLAKWLLEFTYPDQPYLPPQKSKSRSMSSFGLGTTKDPSTFQRLGKGFQYNNDPDRATNLPYTFSRISFVGHSLGGLVQLYAIAYIQKHCPEFFEKIRPENFVTLAAPLLGLSNENPMYVKFALDFGLVGRTGQDLGLTWRPPTIARSGWSAMIAGLGSSGTENNPKREDPRAKPLLRILPSGPAYHVLNMFQHRTVYSNVVNDGIVPLRTSCLLFLDWRGLDRVENARRENGLIGTMASFGWAELTGANTVSRSPNTGLTYISDSNSDGENEHEEHERNPRPMRRFTFKPRFSNSSPSPRPSQVLEAHFKDVETENIMLDSAADEGMAKQPNSNTGFSDLLSFFKPSPRRRRVVKTYKPSTKTERTYRRAQTIDMQDAEDSSSVSEPPNVSESAKSSQRSLGNSLRADSDQNPPPKTSIFESAGDILNPPIPNSTWLIDPSSRHRTIFHDRIYHPEDIPAPQTQRSRLGRSFSSEDNLSSPSSSTKGQSTVKTNTTGMRVEEKIARAYHRKLSWRKVLVRLEPDAHNNIIVRRMFANAYGWDVVKHLCDTHFGDNTTATQNDKIEVPDPEPQADARITSGISPETSEQNDSPLAATKRTNSELREAKDELLDLNVSSASVNKYGTQGSLHKNSDSPASSMLHQDSVEWNEEIFEGSDDEEDTEDEGTGPFEAWQKFWSPSPRHGRRHSDVSYIGNSALSAEPKTSAALDTVPQDQDANSSKKGRSDGGPVPGSLVTLAQPSQDTKSGEPKPKEDANIGEQSQLRSNPPDSIDEARDFSPALMRQKSLTEEVAKLSVSKASSPIGYE